MLQGLGSYFARRLRTLIGRAASGASGAQACVWTQVGAAGKAPRRGSARAELTTRRAPAALLAGCWVAAQGSWIVEIGEQDDRLKQALARETLEPQRRLLMPALPNRAPEPWPPAVPRSAARAFETPSVTPPAVGRHDVMATPAPGCHYAPPPACIGAPSFHLGSPRRPARSCAALLISLLGGARARSGAQGRVARRSCGSPRPPCFWHFSRSLLHRRPADCARSPGAIKIGARTPGVNICHVRAFTLVSASATLTYGAASRLARVQFGTSSCTSPAHERFPFSVLAVRTSPLPAAGACGTSERVPSSRSANGGQRATALCPPAKRPVAESPPGLLR